MPVNKGLEAYSFFQPVNDSTAQADSSDIADSLSAGLLKSEVTDTLRNIYSQGYLSVSDHGVIFKKETLRKNDYRYSGDLFKYTLAGFVYDLGSFGQPNEISIYGKGFQNISFTADGISANNMITNSYDLYNLQSENIDSLEIMPLPRGFLYGVYNNPVTAAIYTIDTVSYIPHSRIRFFQAPENETYFDASFGAYIFKKLNFSFDAVNSRVSSRFDNSNYGGWKVSTKLRYMLSNKINFTAGYNYIKTETEFNGGSAAASKEFVNYDNLLENVLYPTTPVLGEVFSSRYQKLTQHNLYLKMLTRFLKDFPAELTLYRLSSNTEFRQNERTELPDIPVIINDNKYTALGLAFKQDINLEPIKLKLISNYESVKYDTGIPEVNNTLKSFSVGGSASINLFEEKLTPSFFTKYLNYDGNSYSGAGADVNFRFTEALNFYAGYSEFERQQNPLSADINNNISSPIIQKIKSYEIGLKLNSSQLYGSASYFSTKNNNDLYYIADRGPGTIITNEVSQYFVKASALAGISLNMNFRFWKLLLESNSSYYLNHDREKLTLPQYSLFSGIYYVDTLFNANLKLKAGFNFYINGSQNYFSYDFERSIRFQYENTGTVIKLIKEETSDISYQLDLLITGQFQDEAILYITFENLLGYNYYIVPYFPKQPRSLRFGISWEFLD